MGISQFLTVAANTASGNPEPSVGVVVATGLILVFGVLVLLYLLITLEGIIFTSVAGIPGEVVAAIAAAIACMDGGEHYTLRSVKRTRVSGRSAWGQAGVVAYTEPF